jgi:ribosomal protein S18 acetylase RimI-like enzyme
MLKRVDNAKNTPTNTVTGTNAGTGTNTGGANTGVANMGGTAIPGVGNVGKTGTGTSNVVYFKEVHLTNTQQLADAIFNNFSYLTKFPELSHSKQEIAKQLGSPNALVFLIYNSDKKVIGYVTGEKKTLPDGRRVYYIAYFYVQTQYRSHGIGQKALDMVKEKCLARGIRAIVLTCDSQDGRVYEFYRKNGFVLDGLLGNGRLRHHVVSLEIA